MPRTILVRPSGHRHRGRVFDEVPFQAGATAEQVMDIYLPLQRFGGGALLAPPYPVVLFIHAGGWHSGSHSLAATNTVRDLVNHGCAVVSIGYTLSGTAGSWQQYIWDIKTGVRFARANAARFLLDPNRFLAWGYSAGAHGAAMLTTTPNVSPRDGSTGNASTSERVLAAVMYAAPVNFLTRDADYVTLNNPPYSLGLTPAHTTCSTTSPEARLFWGTSNPSSLQPCSGAGLTLSAEVDIEARLAAAVNCPPLRWEHGDLDETIPYLQSLAAHNAAVAAGITSTHHLHTGITHGTIVSDATVLNATKSWIRTQLSA